MKKNHKDWSAQEGDYDTSLYEEKEQTRGSLQEIATPLSSPPPLTQEVSTSSLLQSSTEKTPGFKSLQEIQEVTKYQNDLTLFFFFFLFVNCEPISFEEAIQEQRQKNVMDGEIKAIRKSYI